MLKICLESGTGVVFVLDGRVRGCILPRNVFPMLALQVPPTIAARLEPRPAPQLPEPKDLSTYTLYNNPCN